jgi:elongation factor 1-alpha
VEIRDEMRHMLARVGWKPDFVEKSVPILPISGWMGDNLIKQSTNMAWWKGMEVVSLDNRKVQVNCLLDVSTWLVWTALGMIDGMLKWLGAWGLLHDSLVMVWCRKLAAAAG